MPAGGGGPPKVAGTLGQVQADATHIKFITSPVETESALEFGEGVLKTMNKLKLERIE